MVELGKDSYSRAEVVKQLHMQQGSRRVAFRYDLLNIDEVKIGELKAQAGSNRVSMHSLAQIKRTAQFTFKENELNDVDWLNDRIKPVFRLQMPDKNWVEWPLGVFLLSSPARRHNVTVTRDIDAYDASVILVEDKFDNRYRIPAGKKYVDAVTEIINESGMWKINITEHPGAITTDREFEIGISKLEAINELLKSINYTSLWIDEHGYATAKPYILPTYREVEYTYKTDEISIIHPGALNEIDLFNVANMWVVTASNPEKAPLTSRYVNDLATSQTSTINRKRRIVDFREVDDIYDQQTLDDYVMRIAYESSQVYEKFVFDSANMPQHSYSDMLFIDHTGLGVTNKFTETSWEMDLSNGGKMRHECRRVVRI